MTSLCQSTITPNSAVVHTELNLENSTLATKLQVGGEKNGNRQT